MEIDVSKLGYSMRKMQDTPVLMKRVLNTTLKKTETYAKSTVATQVSREYSINRSDMTGRGKGGKIVTIDVKRGSTNNGEISLTIMYSGRLLTLVHFPYGPKVKPMRVPSSHRKSKQTGLYRMSAEIKRGSRKRLNNRTFLAPTSGDGPTIPFIRDGEKRVMSRGKYKGKIRAPIRPFKTLSNPQMVLSEKVAPRLEKKLADYMPKVYEKEAEKILARMASQSNGG